MILQFFRPKDDSLSPRTRAQVQVYRLLSLLGAALFPAYGILYKVAGAGSVDPIWARLVISGLLVGLLGLSYLSDTVRRYYVGVAWGLLYLVMAWVTALAMWNQFAGEYVAGFLFTYALFGGIVALGSESVRPVLWFFGVGFLFVGGGFLGASTLETSPLILTATMGLVALFESVCTYWGLSMRDRLATQKRELRQQKTLLEQTQKLAGAWELDVETGEVYRSEETRRIHEMGPEADRQLEESIEFFAPKARSEIRGTLQRCIEEEEPYDLEVQIDTAKGNRRWVRAVGAPVEKTNGDVVKVAGALQDITERREAEQALKEERDRLATLSERLRRHRDLLRRTQEVAKVGGWEYDPSTDTVEGTDQLNQIIGMPEGADFTLERAFQFYPPEKRGEVRQKVRRCLEQGTSFDLEMPLIRGDGERRWVRVRGERQCTEEDAYFLTGTLQDITEQKEVERTLRKEKDVLRQLYRITADREKPFDTKVEELIDLGRSYLDLSFGYVTRVSEDTLEVTHATGGHAEIASGQNLPLSQSYCRQTIEADFLAVEDAPKEGWRGDPAAERFGLNAYIGAKIQVDGELYGTFCFAGEEPREGAFSERKRTFMELLTLWISYEIGQRRATRRLEAQNQRLDRFASVVSHDLRNPLNVATGRLRLARETIPLSPDSATQTHESLPGGDGEASSSNECAPQAAEISDAVEHLEAAGRALERMNEIIEDMLALTWGSREADSEEVAPVSLREVSEQSWPDVEGSDTSLTVETDRDIVAHEGRLQQLLENLFRNAIEHGGDDVAVTVGILSAEEAEGTTSAEGFFVEDDGPGIPEEKREKVLETGYTTSEDGTGLGLSIARSVADSHEWDLSITEGREEGARFEIRGAQMQK